MKATIIENVIENFVCTNYQSDLRLLNGIAQLFTITLILCQVTPNLLDFRRIYT